MGFHASRSAVTSALASPIQPDLEYAAFVYVPLMSIGLRSHLEAAWRRAVRCAASTGFQQEFPALLKEMNLTDIRQPWIVQYLAFTCRCHIKFASPIACAKLSSPSHCHSTRGSTSSYRPFCAPRQAGSVSFSNRALLLWNALSHEIREASSPAAFKRWCLAMLKQNSEHKQFMTLCLKYTCDFLNKIVLFSIEPYFPFNFNFYFLFSLGLFLYVFWIFFI